MSAERQTDNARFNDALSRGYLVTMFHPDDVASDRWLGLAGRNGFPAVFIGPEPEGVLLLVVDGHKNLEGSVWNDVCTLVETERLLLARVVETSNPNGYLVGPMEVVRAELVAKQMAEIAGHIFPITIDEKGVIR